MAGSSMPPSGSARPSRGRSRTKFFLFSTLVLLGVGFFGGVSATKRAIQGPPWMQRIFGIELPPAEQVVVAPPKAAATPITPPTAPPPPVASVPTPPENHAAATPPATSATAHPSSPSATVDPQGFLGAWAITDDVKSGTGVPTQIQSAYVFNADGTGEFDTNGKKMYDLRWNLSGDFLTLTYDTEQSPQGEDGAIRMRWSVSPDKSLLTLVPENGKDARATLYSVGPGVYHKK